MVSTSTTALLALGFPMGSRWLWADRLRGRKMGQRTSQLDAGKMPPSTLFDPLAYPPVSESTLRLSMKNRNRSWAGNPQIPTWVNPDTVDLDRFFTRPSAARACYDSFLNILRNDNADVSRYKFIEPSAGEGAFYDLFPKNRRIGIDIVPGRPEFQTADFLAWRPQVNGARYVVVGNPPFGYRAWLALAFLNHSATFCDYMGLILPMAFQSDGKGSPKYRVNGAQLLHSEVLPQRSFVTDTGQPVAINALWQVWRRGDSVRKPKAPTCNDWIDLFTVDMRKERLCGQARLPEANWFLQRTFYSDPPKLVRDFSAVRYVCGYGIVIRNDIEAITKCLNQIDWRQYSNLAAHNCRHISMYHIRQALTDNGFRDD